MSPTISCEDDRFQPALSYFSKLSLRQSLLSIHMDSKMDFTNEVNVNSNLRLHLPQETREKAYVFKRYGCNILLVCAIYGLS